MASNKFILLNISAFKINSHIYTFLIIKGDDIMFRSRLAAKNKDEYDAKIWPCRLSVNDGFFSKHSINEIVDHIIRSTNGMKKITPLALYNKLHNAKGNPDSSSRNNEIINTYITEGMNIEKNKVYNPWIKKFKQSSLRTLSNNCGIPLDALWGIYSKSKLAFEDWIFDLYQFKKNGNKIPTEFEFNILNRQFIFNINIIIQKLKLSPGAFYYDFVNLIVNEGLTPLEAIQQKLLNKYKTKLNNIEKKIKLNNKKYTFEQIAKLFNTTKDNIKLYLILDNLGTEDDDLNINALLKNFTNTNEYLINNQIMTMKDMAQALKVPINTIRRYKDEQAEQFESFIADKLNGKLEPEIKYLTINGQDYTFEQIVNEFKAKGYITSIENLNRRFDKILHAHNDNYNKALKAMSKLVEEQLTAKQPFDLGTKKQASRLRRKILANL